MNKIKKTIIVIVAYVGLLLIAIGAWGLLGWYAVLIVIGSFLFLIALHDALVLP